jgi:hypothetical protein
MANMAPTVRPVVFVGSSTEGLELANMIQLILDTNNDVELWTQGVFGLTQGTLESLVSAIPRFDFAILVLTADDLLISRGTEKQTARDNVLLELGLFMGGLGRDRTFIVYDRENRPNLPSDLAGVTAATFRRHASGNLRTSLGAPCTEIEQAIKSRGLKTKPLAPALKIDCSRAPRKIGGAHNSAQKDVYMKFRVQNTCLGTVARNCRAYLIGIHEVRGTEVMTQNLIPDSVQLPWEGGDFDPRNIPAAGPNDVHSQYGDIVHFSKREGDRGWIFSVKPYLDRKDYQGVYQFKILIIGDNVDQSLGVINIEYRGEWKDAKPNDA